MEKDLLKMIERLNSVHEIQNLMGKYEHFHGIGMHEKVVDLFAQKTPGVRLEIGAGGVWEGIEGVKRFHLGALKARTQDNRGKLVWHDLTTPIIEVAKDGKTAKGLWLSPSFLMSADHTSGEISAVLEYVKGEADFIKEDGEWKIWHMHAYTIVQLPYPVDKVIFEKPKTSPHKDNPFQPDRPSTYHNPYGPNYIGELVPIPPEPYDTYIEE